MATRSRQLTWQYNEVAPWREIIDWCWANIVHFSVSAHNHSETIFFYDDKDYTTFMLRWS